MAVTFEEILSAICSQVKPYHSNDFQKVYLVGDMKEAKLAFDVFVAYGIDAKMYPEPNNNVCKFYITQPSFGDAHLQQTLSAALSYAKAIKQIKHDMDMLCANDLVTESCEYSMTFANAQPTGKQIVIQIIPTIPIPTAAPTNTIASPPSSAPTQTSTDVKPIPKNVTTTKVLYKELKAGPAVAKTYPGATGQIATQPDSIWKQTYLYLRGNIATSSYTFLIMVVILGVLFSLFVFARAFICPDFASMKRNAAWYCQQPDKEEVVDPNQKQKEAIFGPDVPHVPPQTNR